MRLIWTVNIILPVLIFCPTASADNAKTGIQHPATPSNKMSGTTSSTKLKSETIISKKMYSPAKLQMEVKSRCENGPIRKPNYGRAAAQTMLMTGWKLIENSDSHRAAEAFLLALWIGPERADAYWGLGVASHENKFPMEIINTCFEQAKAKLPNVAPLYTDHGRVLEERGYVKEAIIAFEKSLAIDDKQLNAHIGLYRSYKKIGDSKKTSFHKRRIEELLKIKKAG